MSFLSDHQVLRSEPIHGGPLSKRVKRGLLISFSVVVVIAVVATYQIRQSWEPTAEENARAAVVRDYLAKNHADQPWYDSILGVKIKDHKLYVKTDQQRPDFPADMNNAEKARLLAESYPRQIYEVLWNWHWEVPELEFYYVIIQDRDGNYIDGGQA